MPNQFSMFDYTSLTGLGFLVLAGLVCMIIWHLKDSEASSQHDTGMGDQ